MSKEKCANGCTMLPVVDGYCLYCVRNGLNKKKKKVKQTKTDKFNIHGFKSQIELFKYVWANTPRVCYITEEKLEKYDRTQFFLSLFAHVLRKSSFSEFKLYSNNIILLSPIIHELYDNPTFDKILKFEKENGCSFRILFELEDLLYREYQKEVGGTTPPRKIVEKYLSR